MSLQKKTPTFAWLTMFRPWTFPVGFYSFSRQDRVGTEFTNILLTQDGVNGMRYASSLEDF
jgi:hypothetical protein